MATKAREVRRPAAKPPIPARIRLDEVVIRLGDSVPQVELRGKLDGIAPGVGRYSEAKVTTVWLPSSGKQFVNEMIAAFGGGVEKKEN